MVINFISESLHNLRNSFVKAGFDLRLVGGVVRDTLAGVQPKDIDLCTNATPDQQIDIYNKIGVRYIPTGIDHGTLTLVLGNELFEITSLRIDVETDGRHAKVEYTNDWLLDQSRRDFTINSMMLSFDGELFDPFNGKNDLRLGIIKFVGNANDRIQEDYLRILRWFRFMGRFGNIMNIDKDAKDAIMSNAIGLKSISGERIWNELKNIVTNKHGVDILELMERMGVTEQIGVYSKNLVLDRRSSFNVTKEITNEPELLISAWLGNLLCWSKTNILRVAERCKWSISEKLHATWIADHIGMKCDLRRLIAIENVDRQWVRELAAIEQRDSWEQNALAEWIFEPFPVNGYDLIAMGFKPGMTIGVIIRELKEAWALSGYSASKEELLILVNVSNNI